MDKARQLTNYLTNSQIFYKQNLSYKDKFPFEKRKLESERVSKISK